jgi:hypothetical protein
MSAGPVGQQLPDVPLPSCLLRAGIPLRWRWTAVGMTRKQDFASKRVRVIKRVGVDLNATRRGEILEEIVDHLRPWKYRKEVAEVTAVVSHELGVLLELAPLKLPNRSHNRLYARRFDEALAEVEIQLAAVPSALLWAFFNPLLPPTTSKEGVLMLAKQPPVEEIERTFRKRRELFIAELKRLRKVCAYAIDVGLGYDPKYDHVKNTCAWFAYGLMRELSERKITGTADGPFRSITSLLYEAASSHQNVDLKRACDAVLREQPQT